MGETVADPASDVFSTYLNPDLNGDQKVDIFDLLALLSNWGPCPGDTECIADLNGDGIVNMFGLLFVLSFWG